MPAFIDLTGETFGRLTVLRKSDVQRNRRWLWVCRCSCGAEKLIDGQALRSGDSKSCGCFNRDQKKLVCINRNKSHSMCGTQIYNCWVNMRTRCNNPNSSGYKKYGAKGVYIAPEWDSFEQFFADMGYPPSDKHSIDRIDSRGPYSKENCRWATISEQQNNRSSNRLITCNGITRTLQQWANETKIPRKTISNRIARGWSVERALGFTDNP